MIPAWSCSPYQVFQLPKSSQGKARPEWIGASTCSLQTTPKWRHRCTGTRDELIITKLLLLWFSFFSLASPFGSDLCPLHTINSHQLVVFLQTIGLHIVNWKQESHKSTNTSHGRQVWWNASMPSLMKHFGDIENFIISMQPYIFNVQTTHITCLIPQLIHHIRSPLNSWCTKTLEK